MSAYLLSIDADADTCKRYCIIEINLAVRIHVADIVAELRSNSDGAVIFIKENAIAEKTGSSMETHSRRGRMVLNSFFTIYSLKVIVRGSDWRIA